MLALQIVLVLNGVLASHVGLVDVERRQMGVPVVNLTTSAVARAVIHDGHGKNLTVSGLSFPTYDAYLGIPFGEPRE